MGKNWENRDRKVNRRKRGHVVTNRSIFVIVEQAVKRSQEVTKGK